MRAGTLASGPTTHRVVGEDHKSPPHQWKNSADQEGGSEGPGIAVTLNGNTTRRPESRAQQCTRFFFVLLFLPQISKPASRRTGFGNLMWKDDFSKEKEEQ